MNDLRTGQPKREFRAVYYPDEDKTQPPIVVATTTAQNEDQAFDTFWQQATGPAGEQGEAIVDWWAWVSQDCPILWDLLPGESGDNGVHIRPDPSNPGIPQ